MDDQTFSAPRLVSIPAACRMLSIGHTKLYDLLGAAEIQTVKIGKRRLILMDSINAYIERISEAA